MFSFRSLETRRVISKFGDIFDSIQKPQSAASPQTYINQIGAESLQQVTTDTVFGNLRQEDEIVNSLLLHQTLSSELRL